MRTTRWIPLLGLLAGFALPPVAAREVATLEPTGTPRTVRLGSDDPVQVLRVTVPKGARRLHVVAAARYDVDLYVHDTVLAKDALHEAWLTANSISMLEHVVLGPGVGSPFASPVTLFVHVENPYPAARDLEVSLTAWVETDAPVLVASAGLNVTIPPGARTTTAQVVLPRGVATARIRAQAQRGVPTLSGTLAGVEVPALYRRRAALLSLSGRPEVPAGVWELEVGRPENAPAEEACVVRLDASFTPRLPEDDTLTENDPVPLRGRRGEKTLTLRESGWASLLLDVPPSVRSVRIEATIEGGDVDLYATRGVPVDLQGNQNWHYAAWHNGPSEVLFLGGTDSVSPGLYWLGVRHVGGRGGEVRVTWEGRDRPLQGDELPVSRGSLDETVHDIGLATNEPTAWWDLPPTTGPATTVRAFGADKNVELLLVRTDTGAAVVRAISPVHAETLEIRKELVLPEGVGLRLGLGIFGWHVRQATAAGHLTAARIIPPRLPSSYFPPYDTFPPDARGRTLAAAVHLETPGGTGSGVVVAPTGLFLTCRHLIQNLPEGADIYVSFPIRPRGRPRQLYLARIVESDETRDLALLTIKRDVFGGLVPEARRHPFVPLGDSTALELEAPLRVVGYGSAGSSGFGSNLNVLHGALVGVEMEGEREVWLLSDARLGPGNSGAGTFDAGGRLVGVHWGTYGGTGQTLSYATPVSAIPGSWLGYIEAKGGEITERRASPTRRGSR